MGQNHASGNPDLSQALLCAAHSPGFLSGPQESWSRGSGALAAAAPRRVWPTLSRPGEGAQSSEPMAGAGQGAFLSAQCCIVLSPRRTMQRWPGEAEDKGPFVRTVPTWKAAPGSHLMVELSLLAFHPREAPTSGRGPGGVGARVSLGAGGRLLPSDHCWLPDSEEEIVVAGGTDPCGGEHGTFLGCVACGY